MLRCHRSELSGRVRVRGLVPWSVLACATVLAACSADIRRLEQPGMGLGERGPIPSEPIGRRNAGGPAPYDNSGWSESGPRGGASAPLPRNDRVAALPDQAAPINPSQPFDAPRKPKAATAAAPVPVAHSSVPVAAGVTVDVQPGDSLYALSKRHNVSIAALMELNGLKSATLKPGQKIVLPANARRPLAKPATVAPVAAAVGQSAPASVAAVPAPVAAPAAAVAPATAATDWDGTYAVKSGDSLYGIARAHKVTVAELQRVNGITDALKMKPGLTLKVPAASASAPAADAPQPIAAAAPAPSTAPATGGVRLLNPPAGTVPVAKEASAAPTAKVAGIGPVALPAAAAGTFRWPARGAVLAGFGKRPDGAHNDGINIAVPAGTDIVASDAGSVAYAGGEIKAYGNLVLIRHEGGWVTAYAHADQILVKRGDTVTRGQVIAKAGATGSVDQPQVHFELRQGSKPVDPAPHMEK